MKKKSIIGLVALFVVSIAIVGTIAYYSLSFSSGNNVAKSASFKVNATHDGHEIGDEQFEIEDALYPGMDTVEAYSFEVDKNGTSVPVEYTVKLTPSGDLFPQGVESPVTLTVQRQLDGKWVPLDHTSSFKPEADKENYRILVDWPHSKNDIDFEGKTGNIHLEVIATQVDFVNSVEGNLVKNTAGKAAVEGTKTVVSYKFDEGYAPKMSNFKFIINDGDGYSIDWLFGATQKVVGGKVLPRTGVEVAEAFIEDFYVSRKKSFLPLTSKWDITAEGSALVFTSKADKNYENFNIDVPEKDNRAEIEGEFIRKQDGREGNEGVKQVNTLTINGEIAKSGQLLVTFNDGTEQLEKTVQVSKNDSTSVVASKVATSLADLAGWNVTNQQGTSDVVFTAKSAAADKDVKVTITNK
ncbi:hypothetical protein [Bacillus sp. 1P02SD]|uniref:hypothetical protein n=1 Tax=Bacillus sp. 1P02SD TaxID=3132264 RepID=UPI0039A1A642